MKTVKRLIPLLVALSLCGCFQVQDELTLQPDGSGKVTLTLHTDLPPEAAGMLGMMGMSSQGAPMYPPTDEAAAKRFFPAKDFTVKTDRQGKGEDKTLVIEASFKDVNALLASPYGRAHQLALSTNGSGALKLQALTGASTLAQAAQAKPEGEMASLEIPGLADAQKKKGEMRFSFRVTLPGPIQQANGAQQNQTVTWSAVRAECKDDAEFAAKLGGVLEASCSATGLKFAPVTPTRLGLLPFPQLVAGKTAATTALPDTNKILAAVRVIPYTLQVTRTLDLDGEQSGPGSQAELTGGILLPAELAPQRWGEAKLEEATDAKGNSLMPKQDNDSVSRSFSRFQNFGANDKSDSEETDGAPQAPKEKPHPFALSFKAPEWKVKRVGRIKGTLDLQYLAGAEIIKLSNAVPANLVMDPSKGSSSNFSFNSDRGRIADPRLDELGLSLQVQMAMIQSGMTMLTLQTSGGKAALVDAQVFDAQGQPWPTTLVESDSSGGEEHSCQIMVAGKPTPPFSLAVAVGGVGASVSVPILVENVPVGEK